MEHGERIVTAWQFDILTGWTDTYGSLTLFFDLSERSDVTDLNPTINLFKIWYKANGSDSWVNMTSQLAARSYDDAVLSFTASNFDNWAVTIIPEPSSMALVALGGAFISLRRRRKGQAVILLARV